MIVIDKSELDLIPEMKDVVVSEMLESFTGADFMVSSLSIPPTSESLIKKHIQNNAVLIQRKTGMDLVNSLGERLNLSLIKMMETGASQSQRILLFVGKIENDYSGFAFVDGDMTEIPYMSLISSISKWNDRGGVFITIENNNLIPAYLRSREKDLIEYRDNPINEVFPRIEFPLQELIKVDDWRLTIATFPMFGHKRASDLQKSMVDSGTSDDLLTAISWITDTRRTKHLKGMGKTIRDSARSWMGIPQGWNIDLTPEETTEEG